MHWWRVLLLVVAVGWMLVLGAQCHLPRRAGAPTSDSTSVVYLVRHGWHAGIVVRRAEVPEGAWPVPEGGREDRYLEVGWGEARYYPGQSRGVSGAVRAGAWPTSSVLHVVPVSGAVETAFSGRTIVRIPVGAAGLKALVQYVDASVARTDDGAAIPAAPGFYPDSRFYRSGLPYHVFNNCNHWAAGALEAAGCDTAPRWTLTVGQVVTQARDCGTLLQRSGRE